MSQQPAKQQIKQPNQTQVKPPQPLVSQSVYGDEFQSELDLPASFSPTSIAMLQRTIGNQAVGQLLIQPKLTLGPVGDKYEQEADAVAKQVVGHLSANPSVTQRQEDEELQMMPETAVQRQEDEEMQLKLETAVQRQSSEGGEISADIEQSIQSAKGSGQPLADTVRAPMENAFGTDFSNVNIYTNSQSNTLNQSLQARAFTTGQDIFFRQGEYNPDRSGGQELIAHELTHVVQQTQAVQLQSMADSSSSQQQRLIQKKENKTGLPDTLKTSIENLSGYSMDNVKVHYNSDKPAQLQAHAYAQGTDIHLASGQEKHLPHEAWHMVQQMQGRVEPPTTQMKDKVSINDDEGLEREADVMGAKALQTKSRGRLKQHIQSQNHTIQLLSLAEQQQLLTINWSGRTPTPTEALALDGFNSLNDIRLLVNLAQVGGWADLVQLAGANWAAADIVTLAGLQFPFQPPTLLHILALDRFTVAEVQQLMPIIQVWNWDNIVQLAGLNRSAADLVTLAGLGGAFNNPTLAQIVAMDRFTLAQIQQIKPLAQVGGWADLVQLAGSNRPAADIVTLAGLLKGFPQVAPTLQHILALDRFTIAEIQQLMPLWQAFTWDNIVQLAGLNRSAADLVTLAGLGGVFNNPTLAQIVAMDRFTLAQIQQIKPLAQVGGWADLVQLAGSNRPAADIVTL